MSAVTGPTVEKGSPFKDGEYPAFPAPFYLDRADQRLDLLNDAEYNPEWRHPLSSRIVDRMRNDSQVHGLFLGATLPIRRYTWRINPNGARDEVVQRIANDLNLPIRGEDREGEPRTVGRKKGRFDHDQHLAEALEALYYGFMFFNIVGLIDEEDRWRLKKLAPRPPYSIQAIQVDRRDGGLRGIRQNGTTRSIDVEFLLAYIWERRGANWYGKSMLRPLYTNWFIKDKLMRVDALKHQRNGMGVPVVYATHLDVTPDQLARAQRLAEQWRAGDTSALSLPFGVEMRLKGVDGALPDTLASIKYHDEAMARAHLQMFIMLGQTQSGSRALGESFIDYFALAQESIAKWYTDTTNEHLIEEMVTYNYGPEEQCPLIEYEREYERSYSVEDLVRLIDCGLIVVDDALEEFLRAEGSLPAKGTPRAVEEPEEPFQPPTVRTSGGGRRYRRVLAAQADASALKLPARRLRRQPYDFEVTAGVDFADIEQTWQGAVERLIEQWQDVRSAQIDELAEQIASARSIEEMATIEASIAGAETLEEVLIDAADKGAESAVLEARHQGIARASRPTSETWSREIAQRANVTAATVASGLSQAARERAISWAGGGLSNEEVAAKVKDYLNDLGDTYLQDRFGGAVSQAQNAGRRAVFEQEEPEQYYSSELLDKNTCQWCMSVDGSVYDTLEEAMQDYPTGKYVGCAGSERCRGFVIATYAED